MCQQRISPVENVGDGVDLVLAERDLRVHARKNDMTAIVLTGAVAVEQNIIGLADGFAPVRIFPEPFLEGFFQKFLLALGDGRLFLVQDGNSPAFRVFFIIKNADIF